MASVKIMLKLKQPKKDGTFPIIMRLISDRASKYISTGYAVKQNQFVEGLENWVVKHPDAFLYNNAIEAKRSALIKKVIDADISGTSFKLNQPPVKEPTFFEAVKRVLKNYEDRSQVASFNRMQTNLSLLKEAWGQDVNLCDLNTEWVEKYANHRYKIGNGKSTVKKNLMDLGVVLNVIKYKEENFFSEYAKTIHPRPPNPLKLSEEEVKLFEAAQLEGLHDVARDMFLFSMYCQGMRFESVAIFHLDMISGYFIKYRMNKGEKMREIEIFPKLLTMIEKYKGNKTMYLFPIVKKAHTDWTKKEIIGGANALLRAYLTRAAIISGINPKIHFHMARHSFANIAQEKGVNQSIIKDALGHSNFAMTEKYLKSLSDKRIDKATKGMWD